jgi:hypothetical protein
VSGDVVDEGMKGVERVLKMKVNFEFEFDLYVDEWIVEVKIEME